MSAKKTKSGTWEARFYVRDTDGALKYTHKGGFKTKREAEQYEAQHKHTTAKSISTYEQMFEEMSKANRASETTTATRRARLRNYFKYWQTPIFKTTKSDLISWRDSLAETELATRTKNDLLNFVKQIGRFAYDVYDMPDNTKVLKTYPLELEDYKEMVIITPEQFHRLVEAEPREDLRVFYRLLYFTGCRKGEARALYRADFDGKTINIYKSMRRYESSLKTTKNRQARRVPLDDETARQLSTLQGNGVWLFGDYAPLSLTLIEDHFKKALETAGLPPCRIHDLRHSHVSLLWNAGVPVPEISKRIGHNSPKVTMERYAHIFDNDQKKSLDVLNSL